MTKKSRTPNDEFDQEVLEKKIGRLTVEIDFLKKNWAIERRGKKAVARRAPCGINNSSSLQAFGGSAFQLLLQARAYQSIGVAVDAPCGRDLYSTAFLWS